MWVRALIAAVLLTSLGVFLTHSNAAPDVADLASPLPAEIVQPAPEVVDDSTLELRRRARAAQARLERRASERASNTRFH